ncbi:hypothetical protein [Streptomyces sp. NBC_00878]|uniref:DUF7848 domain-containing protein n=1 Tax=Streptomyces sp. NBC_00878 TaxID=2975854 RepID=UPI002254C2ED|nr:hypothetical protein [Streptomyces sp. NBC_00878]MCX4910164.1 hypothetical protein [Streptomyces sp. NBC_00878]
MTRQIFRYENYTTRQDPTVEPEYSAECVGDQQACGEKSGKRSAANDVDDWMREHMRDAGHRHFRRSFEDFAELELTAGIPTALEPARFQRPRP